MKHVLSFVCHMLASLIVVSIGFAPASQANSAPRAGGDYSAAGRNVVQREQPPGCPIDWKPSALLPVWANWADFDESDGAPGPLRVFYPTLGPYFDTPPGSLPTDCGPYPLAIFLHGHCAGDTDVYKRWIRFPE